MLSEYADDNDDIEPVDNVDMSDTGSELPPELDIGIRPIIRGKEYYGIILDSGCSTNVIIRNPDWIEHLDPTHTIDLTTADPTMGKTVTKGVCQIRMTLPLDEPSAEGEVIQLTIDNAHHAPQCVSLFPTHILTENGFTVTLKPSGSYITTPKGGVIRLIHHNNKVILPFLPTVLHEHSTMGRETTSVCPIAGASSSRPTQDQPKTLSEIPTIDLWHSRLQRPKSEIKKLQNMTTDMTIIESNIPPGSEGDLKALSHKSSKRKHHTVVGNLVYSDVFGPFPFPSLSRRKYFIV